MSVDAAWPFGHEKAKSVSSYQDVRMLDLSALPISDLVDRIETFWFNVDTPWPKDITSLPNNPDVIMERAKNPGLGVRDLHKGGITGLGVNVAIIDQPLFLGHPEFKGKVVAYKNLVDGEGSDSSMHGPAVLSLLVGSTTGTAPGANVYYAAAPSWTGDSSYYANALKWIINENKKLSENKKIRVVSVSAAPSGAGSPFTKNTAMWDEACAYADKEGILVIDCSMSSRGFIGPCWYDINDPDNMSKVMPGWPGQSIRVNNQCIMVPCSPRTTAEEYMQGDFSYQYTGRGGLSWGIPYAAGVLAMGWQVYPEMTKEKAVDLLWKSAYTKNGGYMINPKEFINRVKEAKRSVN